MTTPIKTALTTRGTSQPLVESSLWIGAVGLFMTKFGLTTAAAKIAARSSASSNRDPESAGFQSQDYANSGIIKAAARCAAAELDKSGIPPLQPVISRA